MTPLRYVLMTAARDEERFIAATIETVLAQTVKPTRWVIVSDGSTDGTNDIVREYCARYPMLRFAYMSPGAARGVVAKVNALQSAYGLLADEQYEFIGNLDADISLGATFFEELLQRFARNPGLGIAGGVIYEEHGADYEARHSNNDRSVAHGAQLVRRECYKAMGGYRPLPYGGEDWCAEVMARLQGWQVQAYPELKVLHHRKTGTADRFFAHRFRQGHMDYSFRSHAGFELLKCVRRIPEKPVMIGAMTRLAGYLWSYLKREPTDVPSDVTDFLKREQRQRAKLALAHPFMALSKKQRTSPTTRLPLNGVVGRK